MNISKKLETAVANVERVYAAGCTMGEKQCAAKHFAQIVTGDGSDTLAFELPFDPDVLYIFSNAPELRCIPNSVSYVEIDFSALGQLGGKFGGTSGANGTGSYVNLLKAAPTVYRDFFERAENGTAMVSGINITTGSLGLCYFTEGIPYIVLASKLGLKPLEERIRESVGRLPDTTCRAYYQTAKVNEAFTSDAWAELIAAKPNCTFTLV